MFPRFCKLKCQSSLPRLSLPRSTCVMGMLAANLEIAVLARSILGCLHAARQVKTWSRNFTAADPVVQGALQRPPLTSDMDALARYLHAGIDAQLQPEPTCVVHGDIGLHNMLIQASLD